MKISNKLLSILSIMLLVLFLPVLFCVVFVGNYMDYWDAMKLLTRLPNQVLLIIAIAGLIICMLLFWKCRRMKLSARKNWVTNGVLALLFLVLCFVNIWIAKEICFFLPWDIMMVRGFAYEIANKRELGTEIYLSVYSNNIPISYILGRIYRKAMELKNYPYIYDFLWIQVNCALISIAGFFSCLTVKKLTSRIMPVIVSFLVFLVLVGISPWKIAPYTDTYGLIFPIISIYFYVCYRKAEHVWSRYLCVLVSLTFGMLGGFVKPNIYIVVIALLGTEIILFLKDYRKQWGFILAEIGMIAVLAWGSRVYSDHIIDEIGLEFNPEIEMGWQHYFLMGLNEKSTGGYNSDDGAIISEYQTSKSDRSRAELQIAAERLKGRGFLGSVYFYLRKLVMTFNDGLFGWKTEVWIDDHYPGTLASNTPLTQRLRSIFWPNDLGYDVGGYSTLGQLVWIFSLLGVPGICLCRDKKREEYGILIILFLGIFFYQMLLEARARYLFIFLPVLLPIAICGIQQYTYCIALALQKKKKQRA